MYSDQQISTILESISDGVFTINENWEVTSFNRAAEEITGVLRKEALGRQCSDLFRSTMCECSCALRETMASGKVVINKPCYIIHNNGDAVPISVSTAVLKDESGDVLGGVETFRDLREVEDLRKEVQGKWSLGKMTSLSPKMEPVFQLAIAAAPSSASVLIRGETGTGKEVLARAIHEASPRKDKPFIAVNCGALPENLLESELFGHKKGAFTDAAVNKQGRFALAGSGTIFLDEIGDISQALQVKLLRVLQDGEYQPLGSENSEFSRARVICATNKDLEKMISDGEFREDLYYRINVLPVTLPKLNDRAADIPQLIRHFLHKYSDVMSWHVQLTDLVSSEVISVLMRYDWPGNIRELENVIQRAVIMSAGNRIELKDLPENLFAPHPENNKPLEIKVQEILMEKKLITEVLKRNNGNIAETARILGIHRTTLYRKIQKHHL